jgi:hypothetical protein
LPARQPPQRVEHLPVLFGQQHDALGRQGVDQTLAGVPATGPDLAAQHRAAIVQDRGPHVIERPVLVRQAVPAPVQRAEGVLDRVLGRRPVAEHHQGQPDQADRVQFVQRRHCGFGALGHRHGGGQPGGTTVWIRRVG